MKHNENSRLYEADDGKMLIRKSNSFIMGDGICLGVDDDISNYEERVFTEEQRAQFFKDIGIEDPKKHKGKSHKHEHEKNHILFRAMKKDSESTSSNNKESNI